MLLASAVCDLLILLPHSFLQEDGLVWDDYDGEINIRLITKV